MFLNQSAHMFSLGYFLSENIKGAQPERNIVKTSETLATTIKKKNE